MENKPDVICIEETWLKPSIDFVIQGYVSVHRDRGDSTGGGCATFIQQGIPYREIAKGKELEYIVVEVWMKDCSIIIINFYNPCQILELKTLEVVEKQDARRVLWCRDFNAHNTIWGGRNCQQWVGNGRSNGSEWTDMFK